MRFKTSSGVMHGEKLISHSAVEEAVTQTPRWLEIGKGATICSPSRHGVGTQGGINGDSRRNGAIGLASNGRKQGRRILGGGGLKVRM